MDNKTLDGILLVLKEYGEGVEGDRFMDDNHQLMNGYKWLTIRDYLTNRGYISHTQMLGRGWWIAITPEGLKFISEGGFTAEDTYKSETLNVAKKSKTYALWALIVSVLGILVSLVLWYLGDRK